MHGTGVWSLIQDDSTCHGAAQPTCYNDWSCALEPLTHTCWAHAPELKPLFPRTHVPQEEPLQRESHAPELERSPRFPQLEKAQVQHQRPSVAKKKKKSISICIYSRHELSRASKFIEMQSGLAITSGWGKETWELLLYSNRVLFGVVKRF